MPVWSINCHTSAIATTEVTYGSSSAERSNRPPQPTRNRCTTSAAPSAITTETGTYKAYSAVLRIDSQVSGSWTTARKFASGSARETANAAGPSVNTKRCSPAGARNPHAIAVSRRLRAGVHSAQRNSRIPKGPTNALGKSSNSQCGVVISAGTVRRSTHRPEPMSMATIARGAPPTRARNGADSAGSPPTSSPSCTNAARSLTETRERGGGSRVAASCSKRRVSVSQRSVLERATARTSA